MGQTQSTQPVTTTDQDQLDTQQPAPQPWWRRYWWLILLGVLLLIAIIILVIVLYRRRKKASEAVSNLMSSMAIPTYPQPGYPQTYQPPGLAEMTRLVQTQTQ